MKRLALWMSVFLIGTLALSGCKNDNLFGGLHDEGTGDAASLMADGQAALQNGEYAKALDYFTRALDQEPRSSEAMYGAAVAEMGLSGLDIGQLIANIIATNPSSLGTLMAQATSGYTPIKPLAMPPTNPENNILYGINVADLDEALPKVLCYLERIHSGNTDGKIPRDNPNMLINLSLCRLLKAATNVYVAGLVVIETDADKFKVIGVGNIAGNCPTINESAYDLIRAFRAIKEAVVALKLESNSTLADLEADFNDLYGKFQVEMGIYGCTTPGIDDSLPPPTDCAV